MSKYSISGRLQGYKLREEELPFLLRVSIIFAIKAKGFCPHSRTRATDRTQGKQALGPSGAVHLPALSLHLAPLMGLETAF